VTVHSGVEERDLVLIEVKSMPHTAETRKGNSKNCV
jgi:hypothetical protein